MDEVNTEEDRYPSIRKVVHDVLEQEDFPTGDIDRLEVTTLSTGEATWRAWPARAEEPESGYFPEGA